MFLNILFVSILACFVDIASGIKRQEYYYSFRLLKFERECKECESEDKKVDFVEQIIRNQAVERLLIQAAETKIPCSELARLVNRSLYE